MSGSSSRTRAACSARRLLRPATFQETRRMHRVLPANDTKERHMPYEVPPLPYDYDALDPHVDEATMRIHHDKHHQAYVDKVNAALEGTEWADKPIEDVIRDLQKIPEDKRGAVRNNGGGHLNHTLFWNFMSPTG